MGEDEPEYTFRYEPSFAEHRARLGLATPELDEVFDDLARTLCVNPDILSAEVPDAEGIRIRPTRHASRGLPPLYIHYRAKQNPKEVVIYGLTRGWDPDGPVPPL
jgi:hypothetical protein